MKLFKDVMKQLLICLKLFWTLVEIFRNSKIFFRTILSNRTRITDTSTNLDKFISKCIMTSLFCGALTSCDVDVLKNADVTDMQML